jgi:hypothetical protein
VLSRRRPGRQLRRLRPRQLGRAAGTEHLLLGAALSPLARGVLARALAEASRSSARTLRALDLLRALLRHDHGGAAQTLAAIGVGPERVRAELG